MKAQSHLGGEAFESRLSTEHRDTFFSVPCPWPQYNNPVVQTHERPSSLFLQEVEVYIHQ